MRKDVLWGYLSQFLQYGSALLVLPLLLRTLTSAELGIWYVFMTISALVTMLDMGFTPTLARNVSYVFGGARQLFKDGHEIVSSPNTVDYGLLRTIITVASRIFLIITLCAAVLLLTLGSWYIFHVIDGQIDQHTVLIAWILFVFATLINLYYKYYTPLLQGRGRYAAFYKSSAISNIGFIAVTALLLQFELGLLAVAIGFLSSAMIGRWLSWRYLYDDQFKIDITQPHTYSKDLKNLYSILWHNSWKMGIGVIGAFLILRANTLISSMYLGLSTTAAYAITLQIYSVLQSMSTVVFNIRQPQLAQYRISNQNDALRHAVRVSFGSSLTLFLAGTVLFVLIGPLLIRWIGGHTELLPTPLLAWVGLMIFLELNHSLAATVIVTGNRVPFVIPAIVSGIAIVLISWAGLSFGDRGIEWLIASQFFVQLAYNNWKWPRMVWLDLYAKKFG